MSKVSIPTNSSSSAFCCNIKRLQEEVTQETTKLDDILRSLCRYYAEIKTKRQLGLNVPAGFRSSTSLQKMYKNFTPPHRSDQLAPLDIGLEINQSSSTPLSCDINDDLPLVDSTTNLSNQPSSVPLIRSVDKVSSSLPATITMTEDYIRSCVGFRGIDLLKKHMSTLYQDTVKIDNLPQDAVLDAGGTATLQKKCRNTTPVPRPLAFGDVFHVDIVFGPEVSIGNIHYGLLFTDRFSRMTYLYPLQNLMSDIKRQFEFFFAHLGVIPKRIISDFDTKLIGGSAREYLNSLLIHVNAAPANCQDKNGLAERHWQTMVAMARNWLVSSELPPTFWFYAVRRAAEVCNYFPFHLEDGSFTTPFELAHGSKPDLRVLFKPFSLAAVKCDRIGNEHLGKFDSQSIPMITLGRCPHSDGLQFYNPVNHTFVSSIDYRLQSNVTSGTRFGYKYQPGTFFYRLDETNAIFSPKFQLESNVLVHMHSPPHHAKVIGIPSYDHPDIYTVAFADGSIAEYSDTSGILEAILDISIITPPSILPDWIQGGATATLFLPNMSKPRHGRLHVDSDNNWSFSPGTSTDITKHIPLPDLLANGRTLLENAQLFRGHTKFRRVYQACNQLHLRTCILRHVSAHGLTSLVAPTSLKQHEKMSSTDREIWNAAYD